MFIKPTSEHLDYLEIDVQTVPKLASNDFYNLVCLMQKCTQQLHNSQERFLCSQVLPKILELETFKTLDHSSDVIMPRYHLLINEENEIRR